MSKNDKSAVFRDRNGVAVGKIELFARAAKVKGIDATGSGYSSIIKEYAPSGEIVEHLAKHGIAFPAGDKIGLRVNFEFNQDGLGIEILPLPHNLVIFLRVIALRRLNFWLFKTLVDDDIDDSLPKFVRELAASEDGLVLVTWEEMGLGGDHLERT